MRAIAAWIGPEPCKNGRTCGGNARDRAARADIFCENVVAGDIRMQAVEIMRISDHHPKKKQQR
jgi:hypothetical protein